MPVACTQNSFFRLKQERERHGWSQSELAERLGTTQVNVSRWETGLTTPGPFFRQKLAEQFGKSLEELGLVSAIAMTNEDAVAGEADSSAPVPLVQPSQRWNVPHHRNPYFTGREEILLHLYTILNTTSAAALTQTQAISGLGGIGKTQIAVEYAYRYRDCYSAVLWVSASSREAVISDFVMLAALLDLPEQYEQDQDIVISAVKRWLASNSNWLLILDNVDDLQIIVEFLPTQSKVKVLLTTRLQALGSVAQGIEVEKMGMDEGKLLLLRRTRALAPDASLEQCNKDLQAQAAEIVTELDALPLALDQAGAYIDETRCGLPAYLTLYRTRRRDLLRRRGRQPVDHPEPVAATWSISFQQVEQSDPAAADLLRMLAFCSPEAIPEELLTEGANELGLALGPAAVDPLQFNDMIELLLHYSLIRRNPEERLLSVHRLVQAVLKDGMSRELTRIWAERTIRAINCAFPEVKLTTWDQCQRCLPHALLSMVHLDEYDLAFPEAADLLNKAARYLTDHAQYSQAEPLLKKALAIREQTVEVTHPDLARTLNDLGALYLTQGRYPEAEPLLEKALNIRQKKLGPENPDTSTSLSNVAQLYHAQGRYDQAETLYRQALNVRKQVLVPNHQDTASSLNNLAELYTDQGKYSEAEQLYIRALEMQKQVLGENHPGVAYIVNNLATVYRKKGEYSHAEELFQEALNTQKRLLGPDHPDVAETLNNLARLYRAQGAYAKAEPFYLEALAIREKVFGLEHPQAAQSFYSLMKLRHSQGRYAEAENLGNQALKIQEQRLGKNHPDIAFTLGMLARIYQGQNDLALAEEFYLRAEAIRKNTTAEHPHLALICNNLAEIYQAQGKYDEAGELISRSINIRERSLGPDHLYMAYSFINLAENQFALGHYTEAEQLYKKAIAIRQQNLGRGHPRTATTYFRLAKFYADISRYNDAERLHRDALMIREQALGPEHPAVVTSLEHLASLLHKTGKDNEAFEFEKRAQSIRAKQVKPQGP